MPSVSRSDALVFFGATGDLAYKQIFPALESMIRRGHLDMPIIGVAKAGWDLDRLRKRAHDSLAEHGEVDRAAFEKLSSLLRYVDGDYTDPATFDALRRELGGAKRPLHYLAIPPSLFATVTSELARSGGAAGAKVDGRKAIRARPRIRPGAEPDTGPGVRGAIDIPDRPLPRQGAGREPALFPVRELLPRADLEPRPRAERPDHDGGELRRAGRGDASTRRRARSATSSRTTCSRCSRLLTMEPPAEHDPEALRDEKARLLKAISPLSATADRAGPVPRLSRRGRRRARLDGRDLRGGAAPCRQLAMGGRSVPDPGGQAPAGHGDRDPGRDAAAPADRLRQPRPGEPNSIRFALAPTSRSRCGPERRCRARS